jgi:hypothetical protein
MDPAKVDFRSIESRNLNYGSLLHGAFTESKQHRPVPTNGLENNNTDDVNDDSGRLMMRFGVRRFFSHRFSFHFRIRTVCHGLRTAD